MNRFTYYGCDERDKVLLETKLKEELDKKQYEGFLNKVAKDFNLNLVRLYDGRVYHICRKCRSIVIGIDEDVLCENCINELGHSRYSKLKETNEKI